MTLATVQKYKAEYQQAQAAGNKPVMAFSCMVITSCYVHLKHYPAVQARYHQLTKTYLRQISSKAGHQLLAYANDALIVSKPQPYLNVYHGYLHEYQEIVIKKAIDEQDYPSLILGLGNQAAFYWNKTVVNAKHYHDAFRYYRLFGLFADPVVLSSTLNLQQELSYWIRFTELNRRFTRFMISLHRLGIRRQDKPLELAWEMLEKLKSRMFRQSLLKATVDKLLPDEQQMVKQWLTQLRQNLIRKTYLEHTQGNSHQTRLLGNRVSRLRKNIEDLLPIYKLVGNKVPSVQKVSQSLKPGEVLLSFFLTKNDRQVYVWKLRYGRPPQVIRLPIRTDDLFLRTEYIRSAIATQRPPNNERNRRAFKENQDIVDFIDQVHKRHIHRQGVGSLAYNLNLLSTKIIRPLGLQAGQKLIIAVDQNLSAFPFGLLPWQGKRLFDSFDITYTPSASLFYALRQTQRPRWNYAYDYVGFSYQSPDSDQPLFYTNDEINQCALNFSSGRTFTQNDATERHIFDNQAKVKAARYIHLATHSISFRNYENYRFLEFGKGGGFDGRLTDYDITHHFINQAQLVALSACETAPSYDGQNILNHLRKGQPVEHLPCVCSYGESLSNLCSAFFAAGAQKLLLTQWPVLDSKITIRFMKTFFAHLKQGLSVHKALRKTKNQIKATHPNPIYWAGFIVVGE
jgi:CHAT domain-containing protein